MSAVCDCGISWSYSLFLKMLTHGWWSHLYTISSPRSLRLRWAKMNSLPTGNLHFFSVDSWFFFSESSFWKNSFRNTIQVLNSLDQDQAPVFANSLDPDQAWHFVRNVCKSYQQKTLVGEELGFILHLYQHMSQQIRYGFLLQKRCAKAQTILH